MATNKRFSRRVPEWVRREDAPGVRIDSGPFIGYVKNNYDPIRAGRLQVWIPELSGEEDKSENWRTVSYASPFGGTTYRDPSDRAKNNKFDQVTHSYGMWMVPPDIGCQVIVTFIAGDPNRGYWFACINTDLSHHMVPGLAAGKIEIDKVADAALKDKFDQSTSNWPAVEFNENDDGNLGPEFTKNYLPPHEVQAKVLLNQGLDRDTIRGAISSSSQRESPSQVFGISTPGRPLNDPADDPTFLSKMMSGTLTPTDLAVKARKGGHTFVMDDGDQQGSSQLVRLRSAGGHQILMSDDNEVLYIANNNGTAWFEFTGGGHINMYSQTGINVRTEGTFNLHTDQDINMNALGSIHMNAVKSINTQTNAHTEKSQTLDVQSGKIGILSTGLYAMQGATTTIKATAGLSLEGNSTSIKAAAALALEGASGSFKTSGDLVLKGGKIFLNTSTPAAVPAVDPVKEVVDLDIFTHNDTSIDASGKQWTNVSGVFESIATVTPAHEPWQRLATAGAKNLFDAPTTYQKQTGICSPQAVSPRKITKISADGKTNEQLVETALRAYGITDLTQLAAIMAQCSHESGGFKLLREIWGPTAAQAKYEFNANLGNTQKGDGEKYKGRGFIQITGRNLYTSASKSLGQDFVNSPELAEDPSTAASLVVYFFFDFKKSRTATVNWNDCTAVTRIVNGGTNGLPQRQALFAEYKKKYADGWIASGASEVAIDSSGMPINVNLNATDKGPASAIGMPVESPADINLLLDATHPTPAAIAGNGAPGVLASQMKALMIEMAYAESDIVDEINYDQVDLNFDRLGAYQVNAAVLFGYGYINDDTASLYDPSNWAGKDGIKQHTDWLSNVGTQDKVMEQILDDSYTALVNEGALNSSDDICTVAGMLAVMYFFRDNTELSPAAASKLWRQNGTLTDIFGENAVRAYNQGRYAIDVLSAQADEAANPVTPSADTSSSGLVATDVLNFGTGSGDFAHYSRLGANIRAAMENMASEFLMLTKRKITINSAYRSLQEQTAIYNGWLAAGGGPNKPDAGGYHMPAKPDPNAPHIRGVAFDIPRADITDLQKYNLLEKYGFTYPFGPKDPVHIQFNV